MDQPANAAQAEFWNTQPGQNWVAHQTDFDAIHAGVLRLLLAAAAPATGESVLDIGCGSGTTSFDFARAVGPSGQVLGLDISEPLLADAEQRRQEAGLAQVRFVLGDAQVHAFPPGGADLAASRFGVMFFEDPGAAFRNIAAGLRPGGRVVFAAWAGPEANPFFALPMKVAVDRLGPGAPVDPTAPGPMAFRDGPRVLRLLTDAGLVDAAVEEVTTDLHHPGGPEALLRFVPGVGPIARLMREKQGSAEDEAAIIAALASEIEPYRTPDGIRIPAGILLYTARMPG